MQKKRRFKRLTTLILLVSLILVSSVFFIVVDSIKKAKEDRFHSFHDNKYSYKYVIRGVDVSHHNGYINWGQLKNEGITFAYIKATEGLSHKDRNYEVNYFEAKQVYIKTGAYHFYTFGLDGEDQANHFIKQAKVASDDLIPVIDVEHSPYNKHSWDKSYQKLVIEELKKMEQVMFDYYGVHPIIYTNKDCYKLYIKEWFPANLVWMSDLHNEPNIEENEWAIWQFSHTGKLNGVKGDVDLNYFRYAYRRFEELIVN